MTSDLRLSFLIRLRSPLAISSGRATMFADAAVARSAAGRPIIPATAIKGAARDLAAFIPGLPDDLVDLAFGGEGDGGGVVTVSDAELPGGSAPQVEQITTVALSDRRTALPARLATVETVLPLDRVTQQPLEFHGVVRLAPQHARHPRAREAMAAWAYGLMSIRSFGGRTRRGWGQVEVGLEPQAASAFAGGIDVELGTPDPTQAAVGRELRLASAAVLHGPAVACTELLLRRRKRRDNVLESLPYIPGSAIRGHLADRWRAAGRPVDERFRRIFLSGEVRFEHAYPMIGDRPTVPAPLTLAACKSHPLEEGHFAADLLTKDGLQVCEAPLHCGTGAPLKRLRGFVAVDGGQGWRIDDTSHLVTRQRIGTLRDGSGRAKHGALFEEVLIARGTRFWVEVRGTGALLAELAELLGEAPAPLTVGRSRTVMGQIDWAWASGLAEHQAVAEADRHHLVLTSDTILLDGYQAAVVDLGDPAVLADHVLGGVKPTDVYGAVSRPTAVGGWDEQHQLPKPIDTAIVAGSVVWFSAPAEAVAALAERPGLGWRQSEGFGRFALDSPVHTVTDWQSGRPAPPALDSDRRHAIAAKAVEVARQLSKAEVSRSLWQGIEQTVRNRQALVEHPPPPERHPQAASGRGAGAGDEQRRRRNKAIGVFKRAAADLALDEIERIELADDIGQELDLLLRPGRRRPKGASR